MAAIAGYHITARIDRGDAWLNSVDPKSHSCTLHKECAWNLDVLGDPDILQLDKISLEAANGQVCDFCKQPLTSKMYYAFQASYIGA